jgi:multimeric flavodoxin WrbA
MKVVAFNGSPRVNGNTAQSLKIVLAELATEGIETELVQVGGSKLFGCRACGRCGELRNGRCAREDDEMNSLIAKAAEADGILIGSPTYFSNVTPEIKAFIDRCGFVSKANGGDLLRGKVGAPVVAVRRSGANFVYAAINRCDFLTEHIVQHTFLTDRIQRLIGQSIALLRRSNSTLVTTTYNI